MFEEPEGYKKMSEDKKQKLRDMFFTEEYEKNQEKRKTIQKRKEKVAKFGIIGFIIAINTIIFLPQWLSVSATEWMFNTFGQSGLLSGKFEIWQPFTSMWMHAGFIHLAINMFVLWSFGVMMQKIWGNKKLFTLYLLSGLGGSLLMLLFSLIYPTVSIGVGASGAICGLVGAMAVLQPDTKVLLFFFIPAKIKPTVFWFGVISFVLAVTNFNFGIGNAAHLGGLVVGYLIARYWKEKGNLHTTFI